MKRTGERPNQALVAWRKRHWPKKSWYLPVGSRRDGTRGNGAPCDPNSLEGRARKHGLKPGVVNGRKRSKWPKKFWYLPSGYCKDGTPGRGQRPNSIAASARKHGLRAGAVILRKRRGWPEKFWYLPLGAHMDGTLNNNSMSSKARECGLPVSCVNGRKRAGWPEELWYLPAGSRPFPRHVGGGSKPDPLSVSGRARVANLPPQTVLSRKRAGWPEEFLFSPKNSRRDGTPIVAISREVRRPSLLPALAAEAGISESTIHHRLRRGDVSLEEALSLKRLPLTAAHLKCLTDRCKKMQLDASRAAAIARTKGSRAEKARRHGLLPSTVASRAYRGLPEKDWYL